MTAKILALCLLLVAPIAAGNISVDLAARMLKGEVAQMDRKGRSLTIAMKITNLSKDADAFVLVLGTPTAFDDSGGRWNGGSATVTGIAYCQGPDSNPPTFRMCIGVPRVDKQYLFPMRGYTDIEPGGSISVHYQFSAGGEKGHRISFTHELAYRFATREKDAAMSDEQKLKAVRFGTLSFDFTPEEVAACLFDLGCSAAAQDKPTAAAAKAADAWLPLVDGAQYGESWEHASSAFKSAITKPQWAEQAGAARKQTGKLTSRKLKRSEYAENPPNAPPGKYVSIQYDAAFELLPAAAEIVAMMLEPDGNWRAIGYFVKPAE